MAAPRDLVKQLCEAMDLQSTMVEKVQKWAKASCPWSEGQTVLYGGQNCVVYSVGARLYRPEDLEPEVVWFAVLINPKGVPFKVSELSMPTSCDNQN